MATDEDKKRTRSPAYPYIGLEESIGRAQELWAEEERHPFTLEAAAAHWSFKPTSSTVNQVISALKQFGLLMEEQGGNGTRRVRLSDTALDILLHGEDDPKRKAALKTAALNPKIHREIWEKYGGKLPSDVSLRVYLLRERTIPFNKEHVDKFITQLRDTIEFAKLAAGDKMSEAGGADSKKEADENRSEPEEEQRRQPRRRAMQAGVKEDTFSLDEGQVVLQYPESLSAASFEDFADWLQLVIRKAKRSIRSAGDTAPGGGQDE